MKYLKILSVAAAASLLQACSISSETTYYKDAATSMQSNILMDKGAMGMMGMMGGGQSGKMPDMGQLSTNWQSLYDIQKDNLAGVNKDSMQVLKKMYLKLNKENGEILGLSMKYDRLMPREITSLFSQSRQLANLPMQNIAAWDGKTLTIDTDKLGSSGFLGEMGKAESAPRTKTDSMAVYSKQMVSGAMGMLRMFNMNYTGTLKFQQPIKSITGRNDFVKQIDNKTVQISLRSNDLLDGQKNMKNKDSKIIITTE